MLKALNCNDQLLEYCKELTRKYNLILRVANSESLPFLGRYLVQLKTIDLNEFQINKLYEIMKSTFSINYMETFCMVFCHELGHALGNLSNITPENLMKEEMYDLWVKCEYEAWENGCSFVPKHFEDAFHFFHYYMLTNFYQEEITDILKFTTDKKYSLPYIVFNNNQQLNA
jgi:hypothetical protein